MAKFYVFKIPDDASFEEIGSALYTSDERPDCVEVAVNWFRDNGGKRSVMVIDPTFNLITDYWIASHWEINEVGVMTQVGWFDDGGIVED